jgi:hypothetical protein
VVTDTAYIYHAGTMTAVTGTVGTAAATDAVTTVIYLPWVAKGEFHKGDAITISVREKHSGGIGSYSRESYTDAISSSPSYLLSETIAESWDYIMGIGRRASEAGDPVYTAGRMYLEFDTSQISNVNEAHLILPISGKRSIWTWSDFTVHAGTWSTGQFTDDLYSTWNAWDPTPLATEVVTGVVTKTITLPNDVVQPGGVTKLALRSYPEDEKPSRHVVAYSVRFALDGIKLLVSP